MRRIIASTTQYQKGDVIEFDSNSMGVRSKLCRGCIVGISKSPATHGYYQGGVIYKVAKFGTGEIVSVDESAVVGIV